MARAPLFDQVVLAGYPPFVKNVVDAGLVGFEEMLAFCAPRS